MKARIFANIGCWLLIFPLVLAVALYPFLLWHLRGTFTDGNAYTDPLAMILSYLTPIAVAGVIALAVLWRYAMATKTHVIMAAVISLCFTLAPLFFGLWLWHEWNVLHYFSLRYWAWWLQPLSAPWLSAYVMSLVTLRAGFSRRYYRFIPVLCYSFILLLLGATLAWKVVTQAFALSSVNVFAVMPLAVACISVIRLGFMWTKKHAA